MHIIIQNLKKSGIGKETFVQKDYYEGGNEAIAMEETRTKYEFTFVKAEDCYGKGELEKCWRKLGEDQTSSVSVNWFYPNEK